MASRTDYNNPHGEGALGLPYHYEMVSDSSRVVPFRDAIRRCCAGKIVMESGCGTGILSILAAKAGAKAVYAVDLDPVVMEVARENVRKAGCGDIVRLLHRNTLTVKLEDLDGHRPEVVIAENLSTWEVTEPQIRVLNYINENLAAPHAVRLPGVISNMIELACSPYRFEDVIDLRTYYFQFTGIPSPRLLSAPTLFSEIDLSEINPTEFDDTVQVTATASGVVNGLRLTSPLRVFDDIAFAASDSLMPPVVVPLPEDIEVEAGDVLEISIRYTTNTSWEDFVCEAVKL